MFCMRGFLMSLRLRLLKIPRRGLWSTATNKLSHPNVYILECSKAQARARASPSVGEYLDSADFVNREPANISFHPSLQQTGESIVHLQYFCNSTYPSPSWLQSVWRHVRLDMSNDCTPSETNSTIVSLDYPNKTWSSV